MKRICLVLMIGAALSLMGCASYEGGTSDQYDTSTGAAVGESNPQPMASPTFRPGMNPYDPRDSHFITRPQPMQPPATNE